MKTKKKLPVLKTEEDVDRFWSTHSLADYIDDTEAVDVVIEMAPALAKRIRERSRKRLLTLRLEQWLIDRVRKIAQEKGVPYQKLMREWIHQGIATERSAKKKRLA
jgi:predicted DNA binding CopG/RHH family protein